MIRLKRFVIPTGMASFPNLGSGADFDVFGRRGGKTVADAELRQRVGGTPAASAFREGRKRHVMLNLIHRESPFAPVYNVICAEFVKYYPAGQKSGQFAGTAGTDWVLRMSRFGTKKTSPFRGGFVPMAAGAGHGTAAGVPHG